MRTLISSKKRKDLMEFLLEDPDKIPGVREAARACGMSPASVSIFFSSLEKEGFLKKSALNMHNPEVRALRLLFNVERLAPIYGVLKKTGVRGMGMYGSWAEGTNTPASDLDLWVLLEEEPSELVKAEIRRTVQKSVKDTEVNLLFLTDKKVEHLKKKDLVFYSSLFHSYVLGGEGFA